MKRLPWTRNLVAKEVPSLAVVDEFDRVVDDARDKCPLQCILATNPALLPAMLPSVHEACCFHRLMLGSELIPSFLLLVLFGSLRLS